MNLNFIKNLIGGNGDGAGVVGVGGITLNLNSLDGIPEQKRARNAKEIHTILNGLELKFGKSFSTTMLKYRARRVGLANSAMNTAFREYKARENEVKELVRIKPVDAYALGLHMELDAIEDAQPFISQAPQEAQIPRLKKRKRNQDEELQPNTQRLMTEEDRLLQRLANLQQ